MSYPSLVWMTEISTHYSLRFILLVMKKYGHNPIKGSMRIYIPRENGNSCLIQFEDSDAAARAVADLNGKLISFTDIGKGKFNLIQCTEDNLKLYVVCVGNLAPEVDDKLLFKFFGSRFYSLCDARVTIDSNEKSQGFGYLAFIRKEDQESCVKTMDGSFGPCNRRINVNPVVAAYPFEHCLMDMYSSQIVGNDDWNRYTSWNQFIEPAEYSFISVKANLCSYMNADDEEKNSFNNRHLVTYRSDITSTTDYFNCETLERDSYLWDALESSKWLPLMSLYSSITHDEFVRTPTVSKKQVKQESKCNSMKDYVAKPAVLKVRVKQESNSNSINDNTAKPAVSKVQVKQESDRKTVKEFISFEEPPSKDKKPDIDKITLPNCKVPDELKANSRFDLNVCNKLVTNPIDVSAKVSDCKPSDVAKNSLEIVHLHVVGPLTPVTQPHLKRYIAVFSDEYSRMGKAYIMKDATELGEKFESFLKSSRKELGHNAKVSFVRMCQDLSDHIKPVLDHEAIVLQQTPSDIPPLAKILALVLLKKATSLMIDSGLPKTLWHFAVAMAIFIYNHTPLDSLNYEIPFIRFSPKIRQESFHFSRFGCAAYVTLPQKIQPINGKRKCPSVDETPLGNEVESTAVENPDEDPSEPNEKKVRYFFVGYCYSAYLLFHPESNKFIEASQAWCDEKVVYGDVYSKVPVENV